MPFPLLFRRLLPFGRRCELLAINHIRSLGYRIVTSGYRTKLGEVDIIAWDGNILVFLEVKGRQNTDDPPEDSVGFKKQQRIIRAARHYISRYRLDDSPYRYDIVAVTLLSEAKPQFRLFQDAFRESD